MKDLRAFLDVLRGENELATVEAEADPRLEIPEIHRRVIEAARRSCSSARRVPTSPS
jgi:UbiD family decarboxylase